MPIYPSKKVKRARKTHNIWKFIITLFNLVVFNYLIIYADKFQLAVETTPVKASFTDVMPTASADINAQSIIFDNDELDGNLTYIVRAGDTLETIAANLNTTVDNIKRVNSLKSNEVRPGIRLTISQLPGIIVTMQEDISLWEFIKTYSLSEADVKALNNISDGRKIIHKGWELFIPISESDAQDKGLIEKPEPVVAKTPTTKPTTATTTKPATSKPVATTTSSAPKKAVAKVTQVVTSSSAKATVSAKKNTILAKWYQKTTAVDGFAPGYCTAYAAMRRPDIFKSDNSFLGNAHQWNERAEAAGRTVGSTPKPGAIAVYEKGQAGVSRWYGHVAIVESVDPENGIMTISDMNGAGGLWVVTTRTVPYDEAGSYIY